MYSPKRQQRDRHCRMMEEPRSSLDIAATVSRPPSRDLLSPFDRCSRPLASLAEEDSLKRQSTCARWSVKSSQCSLDKKTRRRTYTWVGGMLVLHAIIILLAITMAPSCQAQTPTWSTPTWSSNNAPSFGRQQVSPSFAQSPARAPWRDATSAPTSNETFFYNETIAPSNFTETPTPAPTMNMTTAEPTVAVTENPTPAPTTNAPTFEPTQASQTSQPTVDFGVPTFPPTPEPTPAPTRRRSTPAPTPRKDNDDEDPTPTKAPTDNTESQTVDLVMLLQSVSDLMNDDTTADFEDTTAQYIEQSILQQDDGVDRVAVTVQQVAQRLVSSATSSNNSQRRLQSTGSSNLLPLQVITSVQVDYVLNLFGSSGDAAVWVGEAFNSPTKRSTYIDSLQQTNDPLWTTVDGMGVKVDGETPPEEVVTDDTSPAETNSNQSIGIIVGAAVGGVFVLALGFLGYRKMTASEEDDYNDPDKAHSLSGPSTKDLAYQTEILVDGQRADDISTLGDPTMWGMAVNDGPGRDERTASLGDYDYAKQFLQTGSNDTGDVTNSVSESNPVSRVSSSQSGYSAKIGLPPMNESVFSDDASFEQQFVEEDAIEERFEINVPPGKLGMVIDTPNGDVPIVHAIKSESILYDQVKVGDRLVSVNGIDVSSMTALQVSKLISLKADQHRVLVFLRNGGQRER